MEPSRRGGFTLIELLVVIAIIAILLALMVPAVNQGREAANRTYCRHNLSQMGKALQLYRDTYDAFPPAHVANNSAGLPPAPDNKTYFAWMLRIAPNLDQQNIYDQVDWNAWAWWQYQKGLPQTGDNTLNGIPLKIFQCPSDTRSELTMYYGGQKVALTGYMGVSGTSETALDGILFANAKITVSDIPDGLSQTLIVGERPPSYDMVYGWWFAGAGQSPRYWGTTDVVLGTNEDNPLTGAKEFFRPGDINDPPDTHKWHFWSLHPGGGNFLMADGSVQFLYYHGAAVLPKLATRKGGEGGIL